MPGLLRRIRRTSYATAVFLLIAASATAQDDDRSVELRDLAVQARLDAEGRLHVRERHTLVFDGALNGGERAFNIRPGQELTLTGISRIDPEAGTRTPLRQGEPDEVDEFEWSGRETVRWRSRLESDPPFSQRELVYELAYVLWPVLVRSDGEYELRHDFGIPERGAPLGSLQVDLTLDPVWQSPFGNRIRETAAALPPGRGYAITLPLAHAGPGEPLTAPPAAAALVRAAVGGGAVLVPFLLLLALRRRDAELNRAAPLVPPDRIDGRWLDEHIFSRSPELVGTAWDRSVGEAEVAALLARLVGEGKLTSRVEQNGGEPVLHLRRVAPLSAFAPHERDLLEGLFFDGGEETDTASVKKHYKEKGFDPASKVREALTEQLRDLPGRGKVKRGWGGGAALLLAALVFVLVVPDRPGRGPLLVISLAVLTASALFSLPFATLLSRRVTHRAGLAASTTAAVAVPAALLALLAAGVFHPEDGPAFHRPGAPLLIGLLLLLAALAHLTSLLSRATETPERLGLRRRLVSARNYFEAELERAEPRLEDRWFPYLLAFGLGDRVDRWFRAFGAERPRTASGALLASSAGRAAGGSTSPSGSGWTGGGPQFGGGSFGGGGAGGAWGVAAVGMAAGVAPPASTGGGGGGVSVSGGGGVGGW